ncbi:MAG: PKD domain-containing protein [Candidatus Hermodarchaeota archaeon]
MKISESAETSDPLFTEPYVDIDEWRDEPVRHRYVHGGFKGTQARFSFYFPPKEQYENRFFQYIMPISGNENLAQAPDYPDPSYSLGFVFESGGYFVESNLGRLDMFPGDDPTITGYRTSAAVAKYSRVLAAEMYGPHRSYGYAWGGSGGAYKTISSIENTDGVWDGVVPFIHATPFAMLNNFTIQAHAMRVLKDKMPTIVDAIEPGGSGDMYIGLNEEEREALIEVTKMGFPPQAWFNYQRIAFGYTGVLTTLLDQTIEWDPMYFEDFWKEPGYLGANPPQSLLDARIKHETAISKLIMPDDIRKMGGSLSISAGQAGNIIVPAGFKFESVPEGDLQGASIFLKSGEAEGCVAYIIGAFDDMIMLAYGEKYYQDLAKVKVGDKVLIDNSNYLAVQTYHRHQIPPPEFYVYDYFRDADGKPLYPQRSELVGPRYAFGGAGSFQTGKFKGKMIVVECIMDEIAYAWQADWYRSKVKDALGEQFDNHYRLWFIDRALHTPPVVTQFDTRPIITTRIINYGGVLQQALRDVSAWVEKGVAPPVSTTYKVVDGQVQVPATAAERRGIQPVVNLTVNGAERADVKVGKKIKFSAVIETPPDAGSIVGVEWDFEGAGDYPATQQIKAKRNVKVKTSYTFSESGTYFPAVRVTSQRQGDTQTPYTRIQNIGRVRVVVSGKEKTKPEDKQLIFKLKEIPADLGKITEKFFDAIVQHITIAQGREFSNVEIGPRTDRSTKFEVTPAPGNIFYTISFEEIDSGIGVYIKIKINVIGSYRLMAKTIKNVTSKMIIETTLEILNDVLKEIE